MAGETLDPATFSDLDDLAAARRGGKVLACSDDFFASKDNLIAEGRGIFLPDKYVSTGKWMDGWESRRRRQPGYDWAIVKLGMPGRVLGLDIDTNHFLGNHPPFASVEGCCVEGNPSVKTLTSKKTKWVELVPQAGLKRGSQNVFASRYGDRVTHLRLNIFPDGGVARLRAYGVVEPDRKALAKKKSIDLAALENGGRVVACNDMFFGHKSNLIGPGRAKNMSDGWETRRRRDPGNDWAIVALATRGTIDKVEVDTAWFKGNCPGTVRLMGLDHDASDGPLWVMSGREYPWVELLAETSLTPHKRHYFQAKALGARGPFTHVRMDIFPCGGVSRLRLNGKPAKDA